MNRVLTSRYLMKNIYKNNLDLFSLNKLKFEFEKRLEETSIIINKLLEENDSFILRRMKNKFEKLKKDQIYYKHMITFIEIKILEYNNSNYKI